MFDCFCFISGIKAQTQNSMTEIIPFKTINGKIIIEANINGETANFVLDLAGHNALLPEAVNQLKINTKTPVVLEVIRISNSNRFP